LDRNVVLEEEEIGDGEGSELEKAPTTGSRPT